MFLTKDYLDSVSYQILDLCWFSSIDATFISEFPERPGALRKFLLGLHQGWNITLFHYRNHGAGMFISFFSSLRPLVLIRLIDLGKVLAGIQVPPNERDEFDAFLKQLNYNFVEETENQVYKRYLRG